MEEGEEERATNSPKSRGKTKIAGWLRVCHGSQRGACLHVLRKYSYYPPLSHSDMLELKDHMSTKTWCVDSVQKCDPLRHSEVPH